MLQETFADKHEALLPLFHLCSYQDVHYSTILPVLYLQFDKDYWSIHSLVRLTELVQSNKLEHDNVCICLIWNYNRYAKKKNHFPLLFQCEGLYENMIIWYRIPTLHDSEWLPVCF